MDIEIYNSLQGMITGFGDHEKWINHYNKGYAWNSEKDIIDVVKKYIHNKCDNLLEIAVGYGRLSQHLFQYCNNFYGIDLNQCCIDYCVENFGSYGTFKVCDGLTIPFPNHKFDFIICLDSMVHVVSGIIESYLVDSLSKLSDNGIIIFHHASIGSSIGYRSNVYNQDVDDIISKHNAKLIARENLWWIPGKKQFNDAISIISKS